MIFCVLIAVIGKLELFVISRGRNEPARSPPDKRAGSKGQEKSKEVKI